MQGQLIAALHVDESGETLPALSVGIGGKAPQMTSELLADIRNELVLELHSIDSAGCSSQDVVERFMAKNESLIRTATPALIQTALVKILNQVRGRKTPISALVDHPDLFLSTYNGPRIFSVPVDGQADNANIRLKDMTCDQLKEWCARRRRLRRLREKEDEQLKEAERMLREVKNFRISAVTTVQEALDAAEAARSLEKSCRIAYSSLARDI